MRREGQRDPSVVGTPFTRLTIITERKLVADFRKYVAVPHGRTVSGELRLIMAEEIAYERAQRRAKRAA
jgi:hypothetical protein